MTSGPAEPQAALTPSLHDERTLLARDLGARGSRSDIAGADPGAELSPTAAAVLAAIPSWWTAQAVAAGLSGRWLDVRECIDVDAPVATTADSTLDKSWGALSAEDVGTAYVDALSGATRARHGRHYTPPRLAERLWAMSRAALGHSRAPRALDGLVRDPACGAGALLLPILREHLAASHQVDPRVVLAGLPNLIEGVDVDPAAVWIANVVLAAEMLPLLRRVPSIRRRPLPVLARVGDGLAPTEAKARLVVMNPPYGRVRLSEEDRRRFSPVLYGHANLYSLFVAAGIDGLDDRGTLAAVVPTSFTSGRYFANLRSAIAASSPLRDITFVTRRNGVFSTVLQETCLAVFTRQRARRTTINCLDGENVQAVASVKARHGEGPWVLPRRADDAPIAAAAAAMPLTLLSAGWSASTGPLVWNRRQDDLHAEAGPDRAHVLWASDIDGGVLHQDPARNALRYLTLRDDPDRAVMLLAEPAVLVQRTTAPEQRRRLVAVELTDEDLVGIGPVVVENHVNVLRPKAINPQISRACLARLLRTRTLDRLTRCISGSVALSAYELESLPLPAPATLASWEQLEDEELEQAVARAYRPVPER
ncbi:MAG: Eco57I restriction-modification methylase domain-containing protein [Actinomycetota bacterium]|nr:Eco57I restriction-modification methylase domain-containing protein [Actinomycetota bacterium]